MTATFVLARAVTYATVFVGLLLVFVPARILSASGIVRPDVSGPVALAGAGVGALGAALAAWCILTFALVGRGTPAPFDPPRLLVTAGPYRFARNPMYLGAVLALLGAAAVYRSAALLGYAVIFLAAAHLFVRLYEEPALARTFGPGYVSYCASVPRWLPRLR